MNLDEIAKESIGLFRLNFIHQMQLEYPKKSNQLYNYQRFLPKKISSQIYSQNNYLNNIFKNTEKNQDTEK